MPQHSQEIKKEQESFFKATLSVKTKLSDLSSLWKWLESAGQRQNVPNINNGLCKFFPQGFVAKRTETTVSVIEWNKHWIW